MQKKVQTKWLSFLIVLLAVLFSQFFKGDPAPPSESGVASVPEVQISEPVAPQYEVLDVIDGDTLRIDFDGKHEKVRLLQVNAPEIGNPDIPMGDAASRFTKEFLSGKSVILEYDKELRDPYGRLLCYVFVLDESGNRHCLNEELIRSGMAKVVRYGKNVLRYDDYKKLEKEAKNQGIGIWQDIDANYPKKD